jgi:tRNA(Glu) U13 pseudouridine synthase TruD
MAISQWGKIALKNTARLNKAGRESFIAATQSVMFKAPVDKGVFKNSFFTEINGITTHTTDEADKTGQKRLDEAKSESLKIKIGDSISFVSLSPYGPRLENGYSEQAPNGMVRLTAAEWPQIVAQVVKGIK